jgi:hypothetical protein
VLAVPHDSVELAGSRQQYITALYAERTQAEAIVIAPPFEIKGTVHLRRAFQQNELPNEYIPITGLDATYIPDPRLRISADFAVINRPLAELFSLTDEGPRRTGRGFRQA